MITEKDFLLADEGTIPFYIDLSLDSSGDKKLAPEECIELYNTYLPATSPTDLYALLTQKIPANGYEFASGKEPNSVLHSHSNPIAYNESCYLLIKPSANIGHTPEGPTLGMNVEFGAIKNYYEVHPDKSKHAIKNPPEHLLDKPWQTFQIGLEFLPNEKHKIHIEADGKKPSHLGKSRINQLLGNAINVFHHENIPHVHIDAGLDGSNLWARHIALEEDVALKMLRIAQKRFVHAKESLDENSVNAISYIIESGIKTPSMADSAVKTLTQFRMPTEISSGLVECILKEPRIKDQLAKDPHINHDMELSNFSALKHALEARAAPNGAIRMDRCLLTFNEWSNGVLDLTDEKTKGLIERFTGAELNAKKPENTTWQDYLKDSRDKPISGYFL